MPPAHAPARLWSTPRRATAVVRAGLLAGLLLGASAAQSGSLSVTPVRVDLGAAGKTAVLTLKNTGDTPSLVQANPSQWTQEAGQDRYAPSDALIVSPPIFELAPGQEQVVRVGLRAPLPADREHAFRLYLQEVPRPDPAGGVRIALRLGVPVFVAPEGAAPRLVWSAKAEGDAAVLRVRNDGHAHTRLLDVRLSGDSGRVVSVQPTYLLAGQGLEWRVDLPSAATALAVSARTEHDAAVNVTVPLSTP